MDVSLGTSHGAASGSNEIDDASNIEEAKKPRARSPGPMPQEDATVVTTDSGHSYVNVDGVDAQASQAEASLEKAAVGDGRPARSVDGLTRVATPTWGGHARRGHGPNA